MLIILVVAGVGLVYCKPTLEGKNLGPCAGAVNPMECLHGILMHGDENPGENHKAEDQYLRFKSELETGKADIGPKDADDVYHDVLMHGGEGTGGKKHDHSNLGPRELPKKPGAEDLGDFMHGVLMHGDVEPGHDHAQEHKKQYKDTTNKKEKVAPIDADRMMHGVLMHGDANADLNHNHGAKENVDSKNDSVGPTDPNENIHDLMHEGEKVDHSKDQKKHPKDISRKKGPEPDELHGVLMHGDTESGHDHAKDHTTNKVEPFKFDVDEIKKIVPEDILRTVNLEKIVKIDKEDYKKWKEDQKTADDNFYLTSFPFVMDSILSNIELMKQRYLSENNGNDEDKKAQETVDNTKKNLEFTAEVVKNLDMGMMDHGNDDIRHELELIGSTEPISERHKRFNMRNSKDRHEM